MPSGGVEFWGSPVIRKPLSCIIFHVYFYTRNKCFSMTNAATGGPSCSSFAGSVAGAFGKQWGISQMCLQLVGCSQHHPLTWNVSWVGDNLPGILSSLHRKNPSEGQLCHRCPAHICKADSESRITKEPLLRDAFHSSPQLIWLMLAWLSYKLLLHVTFSLQRADSLVLQHVASEQPGK